MRKSPLFPLGQVVATRGADALLTTERAIDLLDRHQCGDWGCIDPHDVRANDEAVVSGHRIHSAYPIDPSQPCKGFGPNCLWVITEADRSITTVLLPYEY